MRREEEVRGQRDWQIKSTNDKEGEGGQRREGERSEGGVADLLGISGEVHGVLGVIVDLNGLGQSLGVPTVTLARHMAALGAEREEKKKAWNTVSPHPYVLTYFIKPNSAN